MEFQWKTVVVPIAFINADGTVPEPLRCYKQYRRGRKTFWRNYRRNVKGGISFVERFGLVMDSTRLAMQERLTEQLFSSSPLSIAATPP